MIELHELEELAKAVNHKAIKAYLRNAAILRDPSSTPEQKELAAVNVKALSQNLPIPKPKAPKKTKPQQQQQTSFVAPTSPPVKPTPTQATAAPSQEIDPAVQPSLPGMEFHDEFAHHHGGDPLKLKATFAAMTPEQLAQAKAWHTAQLTKPKMTKSLDALHDLFSELKKHL